MDFSKKVITFLILGLFSVHTLAGFYHAEAHVHKFHHSSDKELLIKSVALSATPYVESSGKRIIADNHGLQAWMKIPSFRKHLVPAVFTDKTVFKNFDAGKSYFLSPVNLIFPFQYFW